VEGAALPITCSQPRADIFTSSRWSNTTMLTAVNMIAPCRVSYAAQYGLELYIYLIGTVSAIVLCACRYDRNDTLRLPETHDMVR
jgi:hypothetical protein